jgi:histone H3/H4
MARERTLAQRELERLARELQETMDNDTERASVLTPFNGVAEESLQHIRQAERIRDRSEKLAQVVRAEPVRRMARRAGLTSLATSAPDDQTDVALKTLRQITDVVMFNLTKAVTYLCDHQKKKVVTEDLLKEALKTLGITIFGGCNEVHSSCPTLKVRGRRTDAEQFRVSGAVAEIHHERQNDECMYLAHAPFVKLIRHYMEEQATFEHPLKMSGGLCSCVQLVVEKQLLEVLEKARYMIRQTTKKKSDTTVPARQTLFARDLRTVVTLLGHKHQILQGRLRPVLMEDQLPARAAAKAKAKPKAGPPARAKAAARAKR